jgi:hypothetical protein
MFQGSEGQGFFPAALQLPSLQPRPPQPSPLDAIYKAKGKSGRPSKEEIARREAEAAAEGRVYMPHVRKRGRPKKPPVLAGSPLPPSAGASASTKASPTSLRTPPRQVVQQSSSSARRKRQRLDDRQSRAENTESNELMVTEGTTTGGSAPTSVPQSPLDRARPDANVDATQYFDSSSDGSTNTPHHIQISIIRAVASRLVDGWVSQSRPADFQDASNVRTCANGSRESQAASHRSQRIAFASSDVAIGSKRTRDSSNEDDDTDDKSRKRRRQDAKLTQDTDAPLVRLLACPYQKHDPLRYCEQNVAEKEYRGCASCYILDISRLKYVAIREQRSSVG